MKRVKIYVAAIVAIVCSACVSESDSMVDMPSQDAEMEKYMSVSIDEAEQTLTEFISLMSENGGRSNNGTLKISNRYSRMVKSGLSRSDSQDSSYIHIFNFEDNEGFALMSGDKRVPPVLAFVENGNLNEDTEINNPGFAIFLEGLENFYFNSLANSHFVRGESRGTVTRPTQITVSNKANCKVKWAQSSNPYNNLCPFINGERALAGCVAVACAQLMSVHAHPQKYGSSTYTWSEMTKYKEGYQCSTTAQSQIADLLFQLGKNGNLSVSYGNSETGSGAKVEDIPQTLRNFGYSNGGRKSDYSEKDVVNEIGAGYPVILSGFRTKHNYKILGITIDHSYENGHAWIADGYAKFFKAVDEVDDNGRILSSTWYTSYYLRCNWGWGPDSFDGYFLSGSFHPTANPSLPDNYTGRADDVDRNYRYGVENIVGIRK